MKSDFLVELGCEELPPKAMQTLIRAFADVIQKGLEKEALSFDDIVTYASPRRLAVKVINLIDKQQDKTVLRKGPSIRAAYDATGAATGALLGFARSCKVDISELTTIKEAKGEWLAYESSQAGQTSASLLPEIVSNSIKKLPIPKTMRWGDSSIQFVRPVHWLVMLLGSEVIPSTILGLEADRFSHGHRFHHNQKIELAHSDAYEAALEKAYVIADFNKRRDVIRQQIAVCASECDGVIVENSALLDEVTAIVEWPFAILVPFDKEFLSVPKEALIESMASHQKCFSLKDKNGELQPYFITVANIAPKSAAHIINGNEKVMRARLSDAMFFYEKDKQTTLENKAKRLSKVVFQKELGTVAEKVNRVSQLAELMLPDEKADINRASLLSKASLVTEMVGEFPSLQDVMGYYYAIHDGENEQVATALQEQYLPRFSGDDLPQTTVGATLALADRIDTLVGIFGINQKPTGEKDPFQLRRLALGVIRILIDQKSSLSLSFLIKNSLATFNGILPNKKVEEALLKFIADRFYTYCTTGLKLRADVVKSVLSEQSLAPFSDLLSRCHALETFVTSEHATLLIQGFKRVSNILKSIDNSLATDTEVNPELLIETQEIQLFETINQQHKIIHELLADKNYALLLHHLTEFKQPVDEFFNHVMVNVDNEELKKNRVNMLFQLRQLFINFADLSLIQES